MYPKRNELFRGTSNFLSTMSMLFFVGCLKAGSLYKEPALSHYENMPMSCTEIFKVVKMKFFSRLFFHIFAQNIDCGYTLKPPRRVPTIYVLEQKEEKKEYPFISQFYYIKLGFKGVYITWICFPGGLKIWSTFHWFNIRNQKQYRFPLTILEQCFHRWYIGSSQEKK